MSHQIQNINAETKIIFSKKDQNQIKILFAWPLVQRLDLAGLWPWMWAWAQKWHLQACGFYPSVAENHALALLSQSLPHWPGGPSPSPEPSLCLPHIAPALPGERGRETPTYTNLGIYFCFKGWCFSAWVKKVQLRKCNDCNEKLKKNAQQQIWANRKRTRKLAWRSVELLNLRNRKKK